MSGGDAGRQPSGSLCRSPMASICPASQKYGQICCSPATLRRKHHEANKARLIAAIRAISCLQRNACSSRGRLQLLTLGGAMTRKRTIATMAALGGITAIRQALIPQIRRTGTAPIRGSCSQKAAAKSHRPEHLFADDSCPIIGAGRLGEVFQSHAERARSADPENRTQYVGHNAQGIVLCRNDRTRHACL